jgi:hypothetical protein
MLRVAASRSIAEKEREILHFVQDDDWLSGGIRQTGGSCPGAREGEILRCAQNDDGLGAECRETGENLSIA